MKRIFALLAIILCLPAANAGDIVPKDFSPTSDQAQTLGTNTERWGTVYTKTINDGEGGIVNVGDVSGALEFATEKNHNALTSESRAAENSHPIEAITGLSDILQPATQIADGLMASTDKVKLDNLNPEGLMYLTNNGEIQLPIDKGYLGTDTLSNAVPLIKIDDAGVVSIGDSQHPVVINTNSRPSIMTDGDVSTLVIGTDIADVVRYTEEGNIRLDNNTKLLGTDLEDVDHNLIELSEFDIIDVGSGTKHLNLNSPDRPTIQVGGESGSEAEGMAFVSDLVDFLTTETLDAALVAKADLVEGKVPVDQLPVDIIARTWNVPTVDALITLTDAKPGDFARITTGADTGHIFTLTQTDPTVLSNWLDITASGGVVSVNGKEGVVNLRLADFPDIQTEFSLRAPVASANLTGTPTAPTAAISTNSTQIATTAFVKAQNYLTSANLSTYAPLASPALTGVPIAPTASIGTNNSQIATTAFVVNSLPNTSSLAPLASPSFTGNPTAPTAVSGTNTTQIATTAFMQTSLAPYAKLASPTFTGVPTAPTAATGTNNTQIATTAFVQGAMANSGSGFTTRQVITSSGTWTAPKTTVYKITVIGGGGGGGKGGGAGNNTGGSGGDGGGTTSFGAYGSATGGGGGGGGGIYGGGGGGGCGLKTEQYASLTANQVISVTIGAGGAGASVVNTASPNGLNGSGTLPGLGGYNGGGGAGGPGASNGGSLSSGRSGGSGGTGAYSAWGYGSGGGGGGGAYATGASATGGQAGSSFSVAGVVGEAAGGNGGRGAPGAVIIEF